MSLQILGVLRRPPYFSAALGVSVLFGALFLYFNQFLFFAPYFIFYVTPDGFGLLALNLLLSALSGVVITLSIFQLRNIPRVPKGQGKVGLTGIAIAIVAGACPCYYLVPLLAVAGGAGGTLAAVSIIFEAYQLPIKVLSVVLLAGVTYTLERSLRASCAVSTVTDTQSVSATLGQSSTRH